MLITRARKMRIYPDKEQQYKIDVTLGHCRYIYNKMLERNTKIYKRRGEHLSYYDMQNLLPGMKKYLPWLKDADSQALKYACRQEDTAFQRFFKKLADYPKFHGKRGRQSYTTTNTKAMAVEPKRLKIPCLGWVKCSDKRPWNDSKHICYMTVSRDSDGKYYVSITFKETVANPTVCHPTKVIGFDYKSNGLYADSEGGIADMPHYYRQAQKQRVKLSRQMSKKIGSRKGERKSHNYIKLLKRLNKQNSHIANQRKDYLHKLSTEIANQYDAVCAEDLNLRAMANKGFGNGKAINDNGYGMFLAMLDYKLRERGKQLVRIDRWYPSSQICHICGHKQPMPVTERIYRCPCCGMVYDRDFNAAINIRNEGLHLLGVA